MTVDEKHYLPNKGDLMQTIQIQLSQKKKKIFENFFFHFENLYQKLMYFWIYWLGKIWIDKCLK